MDISLMDFLTSLLSTTKPSPCPKSNNFTPKGCQDTSWQGNNTVVYKVKTKYAIPMPTPIIATVSKRLIIIPN